MTAPVKHYLPRRGCRADEGRIDSGSTILPTSKPLRCIAEKKGKKGRGVIRFAPEKRLLERARKYVSDLDLFLADADPQRPLDALELLGRVTDYWGRISVCRSCLADPEPRLRQPALEKLAQLNPVDPVELRPVIESMLSNPGGRVRHVATRALRRVRP